MNTYYTSITRMPMSAFMDVLCDQNLQAMVITGTFTDRELEEPWHEILAQYSDAMGNTEQRIYLQLLKSVNAQKAVIAQVACMLDVMQDYCCIPFERRLNKLMGTDYRFCELIEGDIIAYDRTLTVMRNRLSSLEMKMEIQEHSLLTLQAKLEAKSKAGGEVIDRAYFGKMFNVLEEHFQVPVTETITVARYCDRVQRMSEQLKKRK